MASRDFWAPDEPRFAQVAREMMLSGDYVLPTFNGRPLALLPPMSYWLTALASIPFGDVTTTAARGTVFVFAVLTLAATWMLGRRMFGPRVGLVAAGVLATAVFFCRQARWLQADMFLLAGVTWAVVLLYHGIEHPRGGWVWFALAGLSMGFAVLVKGPIGVAAPGLVIGAHMIVERRWRLMVCPGLLMAPVIGLVIAAPWYLLVHRAAGPAFIGEVVLKHNFGMFYKTWSHARPFYYYGVSILWGFVPWIVFLPGAVASEIRAGLRGQDASKRAVRFLLAWAAVLFLFFSVSSAKQSKYLLPAYPALAILAARFLCKAVEGDAAVDLKRWFRWLLPVLPGVAVLAGIAAPVISLAVAREHLLWALVFAQAFVALGILGIRCFRRGRDAAALATWAGIMLALNIVLGLAVFPALNPVKSYRGVCRMAVDAAGPGGHIGVYGISWRQIGGIVFYSHGHGISVTECSAEAEDGVMPESAAEQVANMNRHALTFLAERPNGVIIVRDRTLDWLRDAYDGTLTLVGETRVGHRGLVVVRGEADRSGRDRGP